MALSLNRRHLSPRTFASFQTSHRKRECIYWLAFVALFLVSILLYPLLSAHRDWIFVPSQGAVSTCNGLIQKASSGRFGSVFNLDLVYGNMSFPVAKLVDVLWDVGFGRGTQMLLAWGTYKVLVASLMWIMESHPVSYQLFVSVTMSPIEIASLLPLGTLALSKSTTQQRALASWLTISVTWVIIYSPTASAMTGYINMVDPGKDALVKLHQPESTISLAEFLSVANVAFQWAVPQRSQGYRIVPASDFRIQNASIIAKDGPSSSLWEILNIKLSAMHYVSEDNDTVFLSIYDNHGGLTLEDFRMPGTGGLRGDDAQQDNNQGARFEYFHRVSNVSYPWGYTDSLDNVHCIQGLRYQWGFSSALTITFLICNTTWLVGMWITWVSLQNKSQFAKKRRKIGKYRAAIDIAKAITHELGPNLSAFPDSALEAVLKKRSPIRYHVQERPGPGNEKFPGIGLSSENPGGDRVRLEFDREYV